jgi:hypothetical protein
MLESWPIKDISRASVVNQDSMDPMVGNCQCHFQCVIVWYYDPSSIFFREGQHHRFRFRCLRGPVYRVYLLALHASCIRLPSRVRLPTTDNLAKNDVNLPNYLLILEMPLYLSSISLLLFSIILTLSQSLVSASRFPMSETFSNSF